MKPNRKLPPRRLDVSAEEIRAATYVDLMRYAAIVLLEPEFKFQPLPIQYTSFGIEVDFQSLFAALVCLEPGNWSNLIYGSQSFSKTTLMEAGWLGPIKKEPKKIRPGPAQAKKGQIS